MKIYLHSEEPSSKDLFDGKNHDNISNQIASILSKKDIDIVGLEGCLGSGKSTIIKLLKKKIESPECVFIDFDVELYHQGSTKKALITKIFNGMKEIIPSDLKQNLIEYKDYALGNTISYKKTQNSSINLWTIGFICLSVFAMQSIRFLLQDIKQLDSETFSTLSFTLNCILTLSPALLFGLFCFFNRNNPSISFGDIIKRNTIDTITEKMLVSKEVGSIELYEAIKGFQSCIPPGMTFILTIDNLDRVNPDKVREIWSDIELIANTSENKFKILLPYSSKHVALALSENLEEGLEFISKRIPISLQVPPILSAGWRNAFYNYWQESFPNHNNSIAREAAEFLEIWLPKSINQITPRLLKKITNDVQLTLLTTPVEVNPVVVIYYILSVKYNNIEFKKLTFDYDKEELEHDDIKNGLIERMKRTNRKLKRIFDGNKEEWIGQLLCVNYQTSVELAKCELLDEPLKLSIKRGDSDSFVELSKSFGFSSSWRKIIDTTDPMEWCILLSGVIEKEPDIVREILPDLIKSLNVEFKNSDTTPFVSEFLLSLKSFKNRSMPFHGEYLLKYKENLIIKAKHLIKTPFRITDDSISNDQIKSALTEIEMLSDLLDENIFGLIMPKIDGVFYADYLSGYHDDYPHLAINDISLDDHETQRMIFDTISSGQIISISDSGISRQVHFDNEFIQNEINNGENDKINNLYANFVNNNAMNLKEKLELVILNKQWHVNNLLSYYHALADISNIWPNHYIAHMIAHMVATGVYEATDTFAEKITDMHEFTETLSCYLCYIDDEKKIIASLSQSNLSIYIAPSLDLMFKLGKIIKIKPENIFGASYSTLNKSLPPETMQVVINNNHDDLIEKIPNTYIKDIDESFIVDTLEMRESLSLGVAIIDSLDTEINEKNFNTFTSTKNKKHEIIINHAKHFNKSFESKKDLIFDFYSKSEVSKFSSNYNRAIFDTFSDVAKDNLLRELSDIIYQRDIEVERQIFLIKDFGDLLDCNDSELSTGSRSLSRLFGHIEKKSFIAEWLDKQAFNFSKWNNVDKENAYEKIISYPNLFPNLSQKEAIRNRIRQLKEQEQNE
ncbi:Predicted P-loop ATPase [Serratia fonticola]|uniref:P-loop NTPase fold protein n=1 Tax=Serratia fonticola TaxID=47917 RepID=UPI002178DBB0|nr:P-loop NTPase fold protein [Serratia fonticola]CAI1515923.1 Predicted P-loop ATPase [Serratia fonticola]